MQARRHAAQRRRPCPRPAPDRRAAASFQERIIGFAGCVISGLFLNMFSMIRLTELMLENSGVILESFSSLLGRAT
jgi:hypothetical protein